MSWMFSGCAYLEKVEFGNINTKNVTNMQCMLRGGSALTTLNLSKFNTEKVKRMCYMFSGCEKLTSINIGNFDFSNVVNFKYMFGKCEALEEFIYPSLWKGPVLDKITYYPFVFSGCKDGPRIKNFSTSLKLL